MGEDILESRKRKNMLHIVMTTQKKNDFSIRECKHRILVIPEQLKGI